ncbi:hypothetical protein BDS110ZK18_22570 [Bradyrhizobium diazoefficiens]|uniref:Uncharacterized protein n=1 Tax=Bradyrhizobium diazoefficiens TaxID=1355477 RepID=A0A809Y244_9BRAD|nr:hypothetical protein XF2B_78560 [Bradyrhizobium diazoefficiens]BCF21165.1 hypothetical protein XF13B_78560 [Bradyrhizobium diazoefficiens]
MAYVPYRQACLLRPFNEKPHLFAVLNDPCGEGLCLSVMVSSIKEGRNHDKACILDPGDHEFIKVPSYLVYRLAETDAVTHISAMVEKKYYITKDNVSDEVFKRIVAGLHASDEVRPRIVSYAKKNGIVLGEDAAQHAG